MLCIYSQMHVFSLIIISFENGGFTFSFAHEAVDGSYDCCLEENVSQCTWPQQTILGYKIGIAVSEKERFSDTIYL